MEGRAADGRAGTERHGARVELRSSDASSWLGGARRADWSEALSLADLVIAMVEAIPLTSGSERDGAMVEVTGLDVTIPVEARLGARGEVEASAPRGLLATGFDLPHGRLSARFTVEEAK